MRKNTVNVEPLGGVGEVLVVRKNGTKEMKELGMYEGSKEEEKKGSKDIEKKGIE